MSHPEYAKPVDEVRIGRVKATIWRNQTEGYYKHYLTSGVKFGMLLPCRKATTHQGKHTERA